MPVLPPGVAFSLDAGQWHFSETAPTFSKDRDIWASVPGGVVRQRIGGVWVETGLVLTSAPDAHYVHTQASPSAVWTINHGLGKYPSIEVFDSAGDKCQGEPEFLSLNALTITFSAAFSGIAHLN